MSDRDFGIAVRDANRIDACFDELLMALMARPPIEGDDLHYFSRFSMSPHDEESVHEWNSRDLATVIMREAAPSKFPIWLRMAEDEVIVDPSAMKDLDNRTWRKGLYRINGMPKSNLEGRPLWVKTADWTAFLNDLLTERNGGGKASDSAPKSNRLASRRVGRPTGAGEINDTPHLVAMKAMIDNKQVTSVLQAATLLAPQATGASIEAIISRLRSKYSSWSSAAK